jgi:hypothetical protein
MPVFLQAFQAWTRRRPVLALLLGGLIGGVVYWQLIPPAPVGRPAVVKAQTLPGLGGERAVMEKTLLDVQKANEQLRLTLDEQQRTLHQLQQTQVTAERDRQAAAEAQDKHLDVMLKQAQQAQQAARQQAPAPRPKPQPKPTAIPVEERKAPNETPPGGAQKPALIHILRHDKAPSFAGLPPSITRAETPFLPAGSYAHGRVVTGVFATSRSGGALPVVFAVTREFSGPLQLGGPGVNARATALPIAGCLMLGKAQADLGSQRVIIQLETLSCVFPDLATFERPLKGFATGVDGTLGILGKLETHDSAYLAKTFLTSMLAGAAEAFRLAKQTTITTPLGGAMTTQGSHVGETAGFAALANASVQLSQFYLQQASQLLPTLWVESGVEARLVLQEGLSLDGLPTTTIMAGGR